MDSCYIPPLAKSSEVEGAIEQSRCVRAMPAYSLRISIGRDQEEQVVQGHKILIADDEPDIADIIAVVAEDIGYEVTVVHQGDEVVSRVSAINPGTIVLDLRMPGADGVEIIKRLAEIGCQAQIILISGLDQRTLNSVEALGNDKNLNITGSLTKPMLPDDIESMLTPLFVPAGGRAQPAESAQASGRVNFGPEIIAMPYRPLSAAAENRRRIGLEGKWILDNGNELLGTELLDWAIENGVGRGVVEMILRQGLLQRQELGQSGQDLEVVIELGSGLLHVESIADQISTIGAEFGLPPEKLTIKTSGQGAQQFQADAIEILSRLRIKGHRIAFVTESSSDDELLSIIDKLPLDELMVDMSPLAEMKDLKNNMEYEFSYCSLTSLARKKGIETCAINVSNELQQEFASRCKFDWILATRVGMGFPVTDLKWQLD